MPYFLKTRATHLSEMMDDPACDLETLRRTYAQFGAVNRLVSGWEGTYKRFVRPLAASQPVHLLDVGSGGGDIPRKLAVWATRDGVALRVTAIDPDERATAYAQSQPHPRNVTFRCASTGDLVQAGERFDLVMSNHLLHHLSAEEVEKVCLESAHLSRGPVIHKDLERADLAYAGFMALATPLFRRSFIVHDGLVSICKSFTMDELRGVARKVEIPGWRVERSFPFHLLLIRDGNA